MEEQMVLWLFCFEWLCKRVGCACCDLCVSDVLACLPIYTGLGFLELLTPELCGSGD